MKLRTWIGVLVIFFSGVIIGGIGGMVMTGKMIRSTLHGDRERMVKHVERRVARKLDLDDEQRAAAREIISDALARAHALHREVKPQFQSIIAAAVTNLHQHLTPEQQAELEKMHGKWRGRH